MNSKNLTKQNDKLPKTIHETGASSVGHSGGMKVTEGKRDALTPD